MKNRFSLALVALIIFALSLPAFVLAQTKRDQSNTAAGTTSNGKTGPPTSAPVRRPRVRTPSNPTEAVAQDFSEALSVIQENYIDGSKLDYNNVYKSSIGGMLRSLDPHSNYFDKEEFEDMMTDQRSEYFGIGASILNYSIGDSLDTYIAATFPNAPAALAGLRFGDRIDAVDGVSMHAKLSAEVRDKIRGPLGSHVKLTITHANSGMADVIEIVRAAVPQPSVPDAYMISPGVGYIDMTRGFNRDTAKGLAAKLDLLHSQGVTSLVLDLRNNPGGLLDQAIRVADVFLPAGQVILTQKGRNGLNDYEYKARNPDPDRTPLVVLVNDYTASASEIVAGAMQDHDRALVVGQTSFGKGLVQSIINLEYGAGLTLTSAKYFTPSGRLIQRDYSNGDYYNYIYRGGTLRIDDPNTRMPAGPASKTDTGRPVYGGGGITPDEAVKLPRGTTVQLRLRDPIFFFARDLATGRVPGFDKYKVDRPIEFGHVIEPADFPITNEVFKAFSDYVAKDANWKTLAPQLGRNRSFVETQLRFSLAQAAYGTVTALQVLTREDPQVAKAVEVEPRARDLARAAMRARMSQP
ncbi:MAG TPA: S41 family peptidase [Pyrinomonadaceae bacterium]|nr:S41 family peptidase [Pyrinomonadaceae bacterium]